MISLVGIIYLTSINYLEKGEFICSKLNLYYLKSLSESIVIQQMEKN